MLTIIVHVFNMEIEDGVPMISCLLDMAFGGHLEFGVLNGGVDFFFASLVLFDVHNSIW